MENGEGTAKQQAHTAVIGIPKPVLPGAYVHYYLLLLLLLLEWRVYNNRKLHNAAGQLKDKP